MNRIACLALLAGAAAGADAQVVINEVLQNPVGSASSSDDFAEYIEFYGVPGMSLDGYAVAVFKGGADDGDNIPESPAEIDEAFSLDGLTIGANGFLVLYNGTDANSFIPLFMPAGANGDSFKDTHIATSDTPGKLSNDDSSTFLLVRRRAATDGTYSTAFRKDIDPDVNYDGKIDFGFETPVAGNPAASRIDPLQIIDEFAWSDNGGKEYVRSPEQEISNTDGFNPDAVSRVAYYGTNPMLGLRLNSDSETAPTRTADESFVYGETRVVSGGFFEYIHDSYGAPTDPAGDGFADISIGDAADAMDLTPGDFNDDAANGITQFRFVSGDLNFDGCANTADLVLASDLINADFDATEDYIHPDTGLPIADPDNPGSNFQSYVFQGRAAQAFLAATQLDTTDGAGGTNEAFPTSGDFDALDAVVCRADIDCTGTLNVDDIDAFVTAFLGGGSAADCDLNGSLNVDDIDCFVTAFLAGCPR
ncbi:MAG: hypothetical protein DHS20C14_00460 [Phycisphaeraceae bacterium]|nr:MAG: hypothetical protein DHS20C14_00460 [Phycisphaeraceae bacterium]